MSEFKRILITKFRHHGDVLLTSPIFSILRTRYPNARIDALVFSETQEMLSLHPAINNLYCVDRKWKKQGVLFLLHKELCLLRTLKNNRYDLIIHLTESMRGLWLALFSHSAQCITFANPRRDKLWLWKKYFTKRVPRIALRHTVELHLDTLRALGIQPNLDERRLCLIPGEIAQKKVIEKLHHGDIDLQRPYIVIHPTSRWIFKCWSNRYLAEVINTLCIRGYQVVLSAAPDKQELALINDLKTYLNHPVIDLAGQLSLKELAALIMSARLLIGVDSVPMHIAAAVQTPVVALFGPSGDKEWGPWMVKQRIVISTQHPCRPCGKDGCGGSKISDCLTQITPHQVMLAVDSLLAETEVS
ncbi:putative lipopolysaccharide heptosyltransferase III [Edwardsiella tarda]|uniref:putative lipopolysaccharide heptosyltransferase III n=1 Tax=Edwardsiella tarda TaxID=636 RepID=UPI00351C64D4